MYSCFYVHKASKSCEFISGYMLRVFYFIKKMTHNYVNTLSFLYYLLIIISSMSQAVTGDNNVIATGQPCQKQSDCNDGKSIHCGICSDNNSSGVGKCYFPFPYKFEDSVKCPSKRVCDENCNQHGYCFFDLNEFPPIDWIPNCFCDDKFYGRTCNNSIPQDLVGHIFPFITVSFGGIIRVSELKINQFFVSCINFLNYGSIGLLEVECDGGGYYEAVPLNSRNCKVSKGVKYPFKTRFQYKYLNHEVKQKFLILGNTILGYLSSCLLKFTMKGAINFQQTLGVVVTYTENNLICVPVVELFGCALKKEYNAEYTRMSHIRISSDVYYIDDGRYVSTSLKKIECKKNANYLWTIWKNQHHEFGKTFVQYVENEELYFDPMSLQPGYYRVLLEVNVVQDFPSTNYAYCYFNITTIPLVAVIDGGSERTVSKEFGLVLNSTRSCDPNEPLDKQDHVKASWSCVDTSNTNRAEICDPLKYLPVSNSYRVPSEKLCYGCKYNITLKVWTNYYNLSPAFAYATITVEDGLTNQIYIQCVLNCKERVVNNQQLYLRVKSEGRTDKEIYQYTWHYYERGQTGENDTKSIAIEGIPSFMLIVKENSFSSGKSYVIVVRILNHKGSAKYSFDTQEVEFGGNCSITPNSGIAGLSLFHIICQNFNSSFTYEFYDKTSEEAQASLIYSGRMLGTAENTGVHELKDFRVTRGQVFVYIIDNSGLYTYIQFSVNLTHWDMSAKEISEIFTNLTESLSQGINAKMLRYISCITDILPSEVDKHEVLNKLLNYITLAPVKTLSDMKLTTSTLTNVLLNLNKPDQFVLDSKLMRDTLHIVKNLTELFSRIVGKGTDLNGMSPKEIKLVATGLLNCLYAALMCKDPRTIGVTEFSCDLETLDKLMDISTYSEDTIYLIKDVLTFLQAPAEPPTKIALTGNSYVVWVVENDEQYNLTNYLSQYNDLPVDVSNKFLKEFGTSLGKNQDELTLRVAIFEENIFWWPKSDVKSNLVSVSLAKHSNKGTLDRVRFVENHVNMQISLNSGLSSTKVTDSVKPYYLGTKCSLGVDLAIKVHRLDPIPQSLVLLRFLFPQTNGSLLVHVHSDYRPDCEMMMKHSITITDQSPNYPPFLSSQDKPTFFFIGILPKNNQSVMYTFEVNTTVCQFWAGGQWSSEGCKIDKNKSKNLTAHCACNHFSVFAAAFPVPPQVLDPFSDVKLFLTVFENPYVVSFVAIILAIYFICCFWARLKDKNDRSLRNVIILDDNFPKDRYPYLLTVYTSSRFNAGTTAHVGLQIEGSSASSRPHILACKKRKVLKRNFDDWFLIYCLEPLGDLQSIHVWHDNAGSSPDWFCDKIIVCNLNNNTEAVFVIEQWIALRLTYFPEAIVKRASDSQVKSMKRIFLDNCILGLREGHTLLCIILRHPRSEVSRLQRISILMCCLMSSMLCSIMFYSPQVDDHEYSVGLRDFYISVQSLVISLIITFSVIFAFRRSYKYSKAKSTFQNRTNEYVDGDVSTRKLDKEKSLYKNFVRFALKTLKGHPLAPAQLEHSEPVVVLRKSWLFIAWILCVSVILICSFFVMLFSLKLGPVKSKVWLSSVLFVLGEDFFIATPAKIILCSMILSLAFQQMSDTNKHRVNLKDILGMEVESNDENIKKLLVRRSHPMYAPVRSDLVYKMLEKKELWSNWWTLLDFTVALCFIFVVSIVVFKMWSSHYYTSSQVKNIATESHHPSMGSEHFFCIKTMFQINNYLQSSIFQQFYNTFYYNKMEISETDIDRHNWAEDFTHTMFGLLRYRQIRVKSVECRFKFINITRKCIPRYEHRNEDTESYSLRWKPAQWQDVEKTNSPWKYTGRSTSSFFTLYRLSGKSGTIFHNGGYLTDLGQTWSTSKAKAYEIVSNKWQDQLTRAVFVEVTMYNINVDLFSQLTIIVEYLISGSIQLKAQVVSVESQMKLSFWNALFIVFVIYYIFRSGYLINRQGLMEYLSSSSRNQSRLLVVFLGVLSISVAAIHFFSSTAYYDSFINRGYKDTYFDFDTFIFYFLQLKIILSCLLCVAIFRTILIFRGGRKVLNFFYTFTISLNIIFLITMVIIIFLTVEILLVILLNNMSPVYSIQEIIISSKFTNFYEMHSFENDQFLIIFYIKSMSFNAFMWFYVVIFMHYYKIAQTYKPKKSDKFNLIIFLFTLLKRKKTSI